MAAILSSRVTGEGVTCLRIFADADGESHMEEVDITLQPRKLFKDNPPFRLTDNFPASWCNICYVPAGTTDWHNPPHRLLVLWLTGEVEFETSDSDIRRLAAGSVLLAEDTTGKGHISRHSPGGQLVVHVAVDKAAAMYSARR
jgi:quercetin dioxygenase-like cupin family protein